MYCKGHSPEPFSHTYHFTCSTFYRPTADTGNSEGHPTGKNTQKYREIELQAQSARLNKS